MSQLFTLMYGKSKKKMYPIMTDTRRKCENYMEARQFVRGWHEIVPAEVEAVVWRKKSSTVGGNKCEMVGRVGHGKAGWIGKNGFNEHT